MNFKNRACPEYWPWHRLSIRAVCAQVLRLLREERERLKLSKYQVAQRSGVSQQMIGYVERGIKKPSLETVLRIAEALEIDLGTVIKQAREEVIQLIDR